MILGFKHQFVDKIMNGSKIHTIRRDEHRLWQKGKRIHFVTGSRTKAYNQFSVGVCKRNQAIYIDPVSRSISVGLNGGMHEVNATGIAMLISNDGFDTPEAFWEWFNEPFHGVIVHWTDFVYA